MDYPKYKSQAYSAVPCQLPTTTLEFLTATLFSNRANIVRNAENKFSYVFNGRKPELAILESLYPLVSMISKPSKLVTENLLDLPIIRIENRPELEPLYLKFYDSAGNKKLPLDKTNLISRQCLAFLCSLSSGLVDYGTSNRWYLDFDTCFSTADLISLSTFIEDTFKLPSLPYEYYTSDDSTLRKCLVFLEGSGQLLNEILTVTTNAKESFLAIKPALVRIPDGKGGNLGKLTPADYNILLDSITLDLKKSESCITNEEEWGDNINAPRPNPYIKFTAKQRSFFVGSLLGDGCIPVKQCKVRPLDKDTPTMGNAHYELHLKAQDPEKEVLGVPAYLRAIALEIERYGIDLRKDKKDSPLAINRLITRSNAAFSELFNQYHTYRVLTTASGANYDFEFRKKIVYPEVFKKDFTVSSLMILLIEDGCSRMSLTSKAKTEICLECFDPEDLQLIATQIETITGLEAGSVKIKTKKYIPESEYWKKRPGKKALYNCGKRLTIEADDMIKVSAKIKDSFLELNLGDEGSYFQRKILGPLSAQDSSAVYFFQIIKNKLII